MKRKNLFKRFSRIMTAVILAGALTLSGCADNSNAQGSGNETQVQVENNANNANGTGQAVESSTTGGGTVQTALSGVSTLDVSDMFSKKDQNADYNESECVLITMNGDTAGCDSSAVSVEDGTIIIKEAGSYILRGTWNGTVRVEASEDAKVQLIFDGVTIAAKSTAGIYVKTADKVFITLAENSTNTITNTGEFAQIDENNVDGAIFSKSDLTLNGNGTLKVSSEKGHGVVSKDDLKIMGGTYEIKAGQHGVSGKDSIRIADGTINVTSTEDGLHSGNDEDADKGYVYIQNGNITISAEDDGIHGETKVVIAGGTINVTKSYEGIEGAIVEIAGGDVTVNASDDGINATDGSGSEGFGGFGGFDRGQRDGQGTKDTQGSNDTQAKSTTSTSDVYILISGGRLVVNAKGDGVDSNNKIYLKGGEVYVSGPENNGNGALDYEYAGEVTGGTLIAVGSTGMAMNFSSATQGSALLTLNSTHNSGETVTLTDSDGNVLISFVPTSRFQSVLVTSPGMKQGGTYTLTVGSEKQEFTLEELTYGNSSGFGGFGGGGFGGFGGGGRRGGDGDQGQMPGGFDGTMPEGFDGTMPEGFDGNFDGMPQMPGGFDGTMPEGFDGTMPEGFDGNFDGMPQMPGGFDGNFDGNMPNGDKGSRGQGGKGQKGSGQKQ